MARPDNTPDNENRKFVDSPTRPDQSAVEVVNGGDYTPFGKFDEIKVTYPNNTTEVYTYSLSSTNIGTITVTYTNSSKNNLLSVVYNAL
jgi:hypothetical protein